MKARITYAKGLSISEATVNLDNQEHDSAYAKPTDTSEVENIGKLRALQHQPNAGKDKNRSQNYQPLEQSIYRQGKSMTITTNSNILFERDVMAAISKHTEERALPLAKHRPGSFANWVSKETQRNRIQNWHIYYGDLLKQSWLGPGDWENNGIGPLLRSDIITYAVTQLPARFAKDCRCRLFGSPANRFAAVELLIIGYALWQPQEQIYFNPYTEDRRPMHWGEILDIESRIRRQHNHRRPRHKFLSL